MGIAGLASCYVGRDAWQMGVEDSAQRLFEEACSNNYCERMADGIEALTAERPVADDEPSWVGQKFPLDYELPDERCYREHRALCVGEETATQFVEFRLRDQPGSNFPAKHGKSFGHT